MRRAVSTTYYALFHCMAAAGADLLVGGPGANRSRPAWRQAYRALQRHDADYDPDAAFFKSAVLASIAHAEATIKRFALAPLKDRRAFAVYVLLDLRPN